MVAQETDADSVASAEAESIGRTNREKSEIHSQITLETFTTLQNDVPFVMPPMWINVHIWFKDTKERIVQVGDLTE